jgi:hypothetical protein
MIQDSWCLAHVGWDVLFTQIQISVGSQRVALRDFTVPQEEIASWPQRPRKAQRGSVCSLSYRTEELRDTNTRKAQVERAR